MEKREIYKNTWDELSPSKSMILLAGPRQAGKTTFSKIIADSFVNSLYFNWDIHEHRKDFIENPTFFEALERRDESTPLIIFDEIHKYKDWKNYLKGVYDRFSGDFQFLVSGSGRLDMYQKGGDSLAGRYFLFHLWPFTVAERGKQNRSMADFMANPLKINMDNAGKLKEIWQGLARFSGFPEPFLSGKQQFYRRWTNSYAQQLIREDIRDLTGIKSVMDMETLFLLMPSKIGSPLSIPSLSRDLKVSYNSIHNWLSVMERFFMVFSIGPWTKKISRAVRKERKYYLWDSPRVTDPGSRLENMIALELYRAVSSWNELGFGTFSLHFIKNRDQQEIDFIIADSGRPFIIIEAKLKKEHPSPVLLKFQNMLEVPAIQLTEQGDGFRIITNGNQKVLVAPAYQWLSYLP